MADQDTLPNPVRRFASAQLPHCDFLICIRNVSPFGTPPLSFAVGVCFGRGVAVQLTIIEKKSIFDSCGFGRRREICLDYMKPVMDRILLRFRPIAPKPPGGEAISPACNGNLAGKFVRKSKRQCVRARNRQNNKRRGSGRRGRTSSSPPGESCLEDGSPPEKATVTLQLLPERSETDHSNFDSHNSSQHWNMKTEDLGLYTTSSSGDLSELRPMIDTWIFVEHVTDTFPDRRFGLGFSDEDKINNLQADTCPGFVSDGGNNVVWVNEAYRRMVAEEEKGGLMVWLVVKEELPYFTPAFTCRVRMSQQTKHGHKWNKIVACDVWKMDFPGFAWKLDVHTALGLAI